MAFRSRRLRTSPLLLIAVVVALVAPGAAHAAATYPSGFQELTMVSGLTMPTGMDWTPDGRTLIVEKSGRLKIAAAGASTATQVLDLTARVNAYGDRGLLGIAVDRDFAANHFIYLLYTYEVAPLSPDGSGPMVSRLSRYTLNPDDSVTGETTLLGSYASGPCPAASDDVDCIPSDGTSHSIGTVLSAPDGTLYVGSGDAASYNIVDPLALRTYDERSLAGKILHVDRNGNGLAGHAMCPAEANLTRVCTKLRAKGFRNPFRFTLRPGGGLVVGDVGWNTQEEVDLLSAPGGNYGWPCYEATLHTPGYQDRAECTPEYAKEGTASADRFPVHDYAHAGAGAAVLGGPEYTGDQYPAGYRGSIFFGDYSKGFLKRLVLDGSDNVTSVQAFATGWSGVDIRPAPSGDVAFASFGTGAPGTGAINRIVYAAGNRAPAAAATATPSSGAAPLAVAFDASASSDPDGDTLTYAWTFGDGAIGSGPKPSHTYTSTGVYSATVTVSDGRGQSDSRSVSVSVGNSAPTPVIAAPADGSLYDDGSNVQLQGSASDPQDGTLPASALTWDVTLHHNDHIHPVTTITGDASPVFATNDDHDADSYYELTLTARDGAGLTGTATTTIRPRTVALQLLSSPAGAPVSYSGAAQDAPFSTRSAVGYATTISAADSFVQGNRRWIFDHWSDNGARLHDVTIPVTDVAYTAIYRDGGVWGPVLALGFDEGTGTTTQDATGFGGTGTIAGATWTAGGRYGNGLSFDGAGDRVTVADSARLDLTTTMTLEAWVKPRAAGAYDTVLMKEATGDLAYGLYATDGGSKPNGWLGTQGIYGPTALAVGAWSHIALTSDGSTLRMYIGGVLTTSGPASAAAPVTTGPLRVGGNAVWANEDFDGVIDEIRVYDRALPPTDLATDRDTAIGIGPPPPPPPPPPPADTAAPNVALTAPAAGAVTGTVNVSATATDDTAVASVRFQLDGADLGGVGGSDDTTAPYGVSWNTTTATTGTHQLTAIARDTAGNTKTSAPVTVSVDNTTPPPPPPPGNGLVAGLSFDEGSGTAAADPSGLGNAGTINGAAWTSTARFGKALDFDGVNDWVTVADSGSLDLTSAMTVEAWVRPSAVSSWQTVAIKERGNDLAYALYSSSSGASRPNAWISQQGLYGPAAIPAGSWTHLAVVKDAVALRLYVNGTLAQTLATGVSAPVSSGALRIGGSSMWGEYFKGVIDEVRVYNRALSGAEVLTDRDTAVRASSTPPPPPPPPPPTPVVALGFDEGTGTAAADASGGGRNGTISGPTWSTDARFGKALSFDGVNDWVTVPDGQALDITGAITIEAWVKLRVAGGWQTVAIKEAPGDLAYGLYAASTGSPLPSAWLGQSGFYGPRPVPVNAWTHLAVTYDGTATRLYVNGVVVATRTGAVVIPVTAGALRLGGSSMWGEWFSGLMDEVRVYGRALSTNEVNADMGTPIAG